MTLCLVLDGNRVLLGMKKRGFGKGNWNGFGGKIETNETIEDGAIRELKEEAGILALDLKKQGINLFKFEGNPVAMEVHIFSATKFEGEIVESEEMKPEWFDLDGIPYDSMWPDDRLWLPMLLAGKNFEGEFNFDNKNNIVSHRLEEVENL